MKIVIDIPNSTFTDLKKKQNRTEVDVAVLNGTPLTDILGKMRAEIIESSIKDYEYHGCGTDELIIETSETLRVLDKYKAESEG